MILAAFTACVGYSAIDNQGDESEKGKFIEKPALEKCKKKK